MCMGRVSVELVADGITDAALLHAASPKAQPDEEPRRVAAL